VKEKEKGKHEEKREKGVKKGAEPESKENINKV